MLAAGSRSGRRLVPFVMHACTHLLARTAKAAYTMSLKLHTVIDFLTSLADCSNILEAVAVATVDAKFLLLSPPRKSRKPLVHCLGVKLCTEATRTKQIVANNFIFGLLLSIKEYDTSRMRTTTI